MICDSLFIVSCNPTLYRIDPLDYSSVCRVICQPARTLSVDVCRKSIDTHTYMLIAQPPSVQSEFAGTLRTPLPSKKSMRQTDVLQEKKIEIERAPAAIILTLIIYPAPALEVGGREHRAILLISRDRMSLFCANFGSLCLDIQSRILCNMQLQTMCKAIKGEFNQVIDVGLLPGQSPRYESELGNCKWFLNLEVTNLHNTVNIDFLDKSGTKELVDTVTRSCGTALMLSG
ncbi:hypothetical protein J6590_013438 [Homalodisca vitripennis]|nr:hypothetical protein J6590_013438 [Homalodisca vitripennis]